MKIDERDLDGFSSEVVDRCMATRRERIQMYNGLFHYYLFGDRKSTRLNSSHIQKSRMPSSA